MGGTLVWTSSCKHGQKGPHIIRFEWDDDGFSTEVWCDGDVTGPVKKED